MSISGFPELLPAERLVEQEVLDRLRWVFELHGFAPLETPAVEPLDQLLRKGEIDKEVYVLRRLHADEADEPLDHPHALGLHYDLTVPFARYVLEHAGHLEFPFRRYQIQKVWRGERPQAGRFREFTQADIDVVAKDELPFHHDVEIARVMAEALAALDFLPPLRLQVSNRRLLEGFLLGLGAPDPGAAMREIDRLDKVPPQVVAGGLQAVGLSEEQTLQCLRLAEIRSADTSFVDRVWALGVAHELLDQGLTELAQVIAGCSDIRGVIVEADLRIARGLDYYTGTVFETRMAGYEHLGSICSGGRYDSLATDGKTTYPGTGISLGVTRLLIPLLLDGTVAGSRPTPSVVLVALASDETRADSAAVAQALRARGIATEVSPTAQKYGKQIRYADRRGIPFVWFPGEPDEVKDLRSGEQEPADPAVWTPPEADLRPRVLRTTPDKM